MNALDYIIISIVVVWVIAAICFLVRAKKKGKSICCGSCSSCTTGCKMHKKDIAKKDNKN